MKSFFIIPVLFSSICYGQELKKTTDRTNNVEVVIFEDQRIPPRIPILITKTTSLDTAKSFVYYDMGLYVILNHVPVNFFMQQNGAIVFENGSKMKLGEEIHHIFLSGGKHQISIRHRLTQIELKQLQENKIDYLVIGNFKDSFDRFERDNMRDAFRRIEKE